MKILILNTNENMGGAATACNRLIQAINTTDHKAKGLVLNVEKKNDQFYSINSKKTSQVYYYLEKADFLRYEKSKNIRFQFSTSKFGYDISKHPLVLEADVIHLHWFNQGFLSLTSIEKLLALNKPVVWTLHDMWAFTGGCHYSGSCENYKMECGNCKFLRRPSLEDLSNKIWKRKRHISGYDSIKYVTCSRWLSKVAKSSSLLSASSVVDIPNPINVDLYKPGRSQKEHRTYLLFQSMNVNDERKGLKYLLKALALLATSNPILIENITLLVFGKGGEEIQLSANIEIEYIGLIRDEDLIVSMYQKAKIFVIPSLEDNLPNTIMESLACGTPVVGFDSGGIPEMIDHKKSGYVAKQRDEKDLAKGIEWCLEDDARYQQLSKAARQKVLTCYSNEVVSKSYLDLYESLIDEVP